MFHNNGQPNLNNTTNTNQMNHTSNMKINMVTPMMTDEEMERMIHNCAHKDSTGAKTWTRIVVESCLSKYQWYFPKRRPKSHTSTTTNSTTAGGVGGSAVSKGPSLSKAYAYYEHVTLPRKESGGNGGGGGTSLTSFLRADHIQRRADRGLSSGSTATYNPTHARNNKNSSNNNDNNNAKATTTATTTAPPPVITTELFSPFTTPASALIEWGVGIDLYFTTLRYMSVMLLAAGLINLPNILFYRGESYSPMGRTNVSWTLDTSAVCTSGQWVVCDASTYGPCTSDDDELDRVRTSLDGTSLVLRNDCAGGQFTQGMVNLGTGLFLVLMIALLSFYLLQRERLADEDKVNVSDFSVLVRNPPKDAYNPDDWHAFFSQYAEKQVTVVTVALNNDLLLRKLVERRRRLRSLKLLLLPNVVDLEDESATRLAVTRFLKEQEEVPPGCLIRFLDLFVFPFFRPFGMFLKPETLVNSVFRLRSEIQELQCQKYDVCSVFVTFETQEGRRTALSSLSVGKINLMARNIASAAPGALFQETLLNVKSVSDPTSIRWLDLGASRTRKLTMRFVNLGVTVAVIVLAGLCVAKVRVNIGASFSGPLIAIFNSAIPILIKILMIFERHVTEGSFQTSLYLKITLFRWVNTAILTKFITPFTSTVSPNPKDVLVQVNSILWSELLLTPCLRLLDIVGNFRKHVLAPRAVNQEMMNLNFQGTPYNMGERYTDMTKVMFLVFFYSALFPSSFFFGCAILTVQYFADKYCLMRIWSWSPNLGSELAKFSCRYFYFGALLAYFLVSAYAWAQFPYDNLCDPIEDNRVYGMARDYTYVDANGATQVTTVEQDWAVVFCNQNWIDAVVFPFPPTPRLQPPGLQWMNDSQAQLTTVYGWTSVFALFIFVVIFFGNAITRFIVSWFRGVYRPEDDGQNQYIDFSSDPGMDGYVPQIRAPGFPFPFLACDTHDIDEALIGWKVNYRSFDDFNLIFDVPWKGMPIRRRADGTTHEAAATSFGYSESQGPSGIASASNRPPIYSIIKHYPPDWKIKLENEAVAASMMESSRMSL